MNRGVSSGGGQSSLGYLFGSGEAPKPAPKATQAAPCEAPVATNVRAPKPEPVSPPVDITKQIPTGINSNSSNNYFRADGQNTGNFITDPNLDRIEESPRKTSSVILITLKVPRR